MEMAKKTSSNDKEMFSVKQSSENERQLDQHAVESTTKNSTTIGRESGATTTPFHHCLH